MLLYYVYDFADKKIREADFNDPSTYSKYKLEKDGDTYNAVLVPDNELKEYNESLYNAFQNRDDTIVEYMLDLKLQYDATNYSLVDNSLYRLYKDAIGDQFDN